MKFKNILITGLIFCLVSLFLVNGFARKDIEPSKESNNSFIKKVFKQESIIKTSHQNKELVVQLLETLNKEIKPTEKNYKSCIKLSNLIYADLPLLNDKRKLIKVLHNCRSVRNSYGVSKDKINNWKALRRKLNSEGWLSIIHDLENGAISPDFSLQEGKPAHNLPILFLQGGVDNKEAFKKLANYGVEFNTKFLSVALIRKNKTAIDFFLENYDRIHDDLLYNPVMHAAKFGTLEDMEKFLERGYSYHDELSRSPLISYLKRSQGKVNEKQLESFIFKHSPNISEEDINELSKINVPVNIINLLKNNILN